MDISSVHVPAPVSATPSEPSPAKALPEDQRALIRAVKAVNHAELFGQENELTFMLDRASHRTVVRVVNKQTHEVLQQIPAEYVLRMAEEASRG